jgi:hypothetical protein
MRCRLSGVLAFVYTAGRAYFIPVARGADSER